MADFSGITATEAEIDQKSGANVSAAFTSDMKTASLLHAESFLNGETRFNWSDWYATGSASGGVPNSDVKSIITAYTASWVASDAINYDLDAIGRGAANLMLNYLRDIMQRAIATLKDKSTNQAWIKENA